MVLCKYFAQGYCRFNDNCRFEHSTNDRSDYGYRPQYDSSRSSGPLLRTPPRYNEPPNAQNISSADLILLDIDQMIKGHHYIYTCVPAGNRLNLNCKSLHDFSPEEIRVHYMTTLATNSSAWTTNVDFQSTFFRELKGNREKILRQILAQPAKLDDSEPPPRMSMVEHFRPFIPIDFVGGVSVVPQNPVLPAVNFQMSGPVPSPPHNPFSKQNDQQTTLFGKPDIKAQPNLFGNVDHQHGSPNFGQHVPSNAVFSPADPQSFQQFQQTAPSVFAQPQLGHPPATNQVNFFGQQQQQQAPQMQAFSDPRLTFGTSASILDQAAQQAMAEETVEKDTEANRHRFSHEDQTEIYTPMEKLTEEQSAAFKARTFTLDNLPLDPPPRELCF